MKGICGGGDGILVGDLVKGEVVEGEGRFGGGEMWIDDGILEGEGGLGGGMGYSGW